MIITLSASVSFVVTNDQNIYLFFLIISEYESEKMTCWRNFFSFLFVGFKGIVVSFILPARTFLADVDVEVIINYSLTILHESHHSPISWIVYRLILFFIVTTTNRKAIYFFRQKNSITLRNHSSQIVKHIIISEANDTESNYPFDIACCINHGMIELSGGKSENARKLSKNPIKMTISPLTLHFSSSFHIRNGKQWQ